MEYKTKFCPGDLVVPAPNGFVEGWPGFVPQGKIHAVAFTPCQTTFSCRKCTNPIPVRIIGITPPPGHDYCECQWVHYNPPAPELIQHHTERPRLEPVNE